MGKAKKAKNAKLPQDRLNAKARAAAGAAATAGRARTFADKKDKLVKAGGDPEINEGLEEYEEAKESKQAEQLSISVTVNGTSDSELEIGLEEVLRLVRAGNTSGAGGTKENGFSFDIKGK